MQRNIRSRAWAGLGALLLSACGGDGGNLGPDFRTPAAQFAQQCAPNNPFVDDAVTSTSSASLAREKEWVAAYLDAAYLWYDEIPTVNPDSAAYSDDFDVVGSLERYFNAMLTPAITPSGKPKDQFSFIFPTRLWNELSQGGIELGYGMQLEFNPTPPRDTRVVFVEENTPAADADVARGLAIVAIDGASTESSTPDDVATLNDGLFPDEPGEVHTFTFERPNRTRFSADLAAAEIVRAPVPLASVLQSGNRSVGYLLFNDHLATAEQPLIDAITLFRDAGIDDLVLDLRYNGGGFLYIASQLAYMIAGPERSAGKVFERLQYNDKRQAELTADDTDFPFVDCRSDSNFNCSRGSLPTLDLPRVFVIATGGSCSASESIINGLRGIDVDVRLIGDTTCGKPYGFTAQDNCGISYFPIEFKGVNAKGFGDYADGFTPNCAEADDLTRELGDPREAMLATALSLQSGNACGTAKVLMRPGTTLIRSPLRENRLLLPAQSR